MTLVQARNNATFTPADFKNVVTTPPTPDQVTDLIIASTTLKYTQSNSVCYVKNGMVVGLGAGQQSRIHCTRLAGDKTDNWYCRFVAFNSRFHQKVLSLAFKQGVKRADKANAIDQYITGEIDDGFNSLFDVVPEPFTDLEKKQWIKGLQGVVLASDAFFPFKDNVERAKRSGVAVIGAPGGSVNDEIVFQAAREAGISFVQTPYRLFHH